jgi:tetratricopeptide (TPR) repeat protein
MRRTQFFGAALLAALTAGAPAAPAQSPTPADPVLAAAAEALRGCLAYVEGSEELKERKKEAVLAAERAERLYRALIRSRPDDPAGHVGLAQTLTRCRLPYASMMRTIVLVEESSGAYRKALTLDPRHWEARFGLAMNYFHTPAFLGKTNDAIREFERLLAQQGARTEPAAFALPYLYLGELFERSSREADAERIWRKGASLFPDHAGLARKLERMSGAREPAPREPGGGSTPEARASAAGAERTTTKTAEEETTVYALAPLIAEVSHHQLEDARSGTALRRLDIVTLPGGTAEMLQALQTLPGVTRAGEGSDLYVRGGDPAETPVFVDGGRLAFPGRWESLNGSAMGVLDASVLRRAYFSAGGFSARYGNGLSGVVDVETQGRPATPIGRIGVNMVQAGASGQTPIGARTGGWANASITDVSLLTHVNGSADLYSRAPRSMQAVAGVSVEPRRGMELRAVGLSMGDVSGRIVDVGGHHGAFESTGRTRHGALSGRMISGDARRGVSASVTGSYRRGGFEFGVLDRERTDRSAGARVDGDLVLAGGTRIRGGVEAALLQATTSGRVPVTPDVRPGAPSLVLEDDEQSASHLGAYIEAEHSPRPGLSLVAGLRADELPGSDAVTVDPRLAVGYNTGDWTARLAGGVFHQGPWRARYRLPNAGVPSGVPTRAEHLVAGLERGGEPAIRVEGYLKRYGDFAPDGEGPAAVAGRQLGLDAMVRWSRNERLNGWITYSLLDGRLELEDGRDVASALNVTHSVTVVGRLAISELWELGSTLRYATGRPYSGVSGSVPAGTPGYPPVPVYSGVHDERLPRYARLDGRVTRYVPLRGGMAIAYVEMLNLLDRENVLGYSYDATYGQRLPITSFYRSRTAVVGVELQRNRGR